MPSSYQPRMVPAPVLSLRQKLSHCIHHETLSHKNKLEESQINSRITGFRITQARTHVYLAHATEGSLGTPRLYGCLALRWHRVEGSAALRLWLKALLGILLPTLVWPWRTSQVALFLQTSLHTVPLLSSQYDVISHDHQSC